MNHKKEITTETKKHLSDGSDLIVSVSGGKDSTAVCLRLFQMGYKKEDFERVFFDTGWESQATYDYLDYLETKIGKIKRLKRKVDISNYPQDAKNIILQLEKELGFESPFVRLTFKNMTFPTRFRKWCTRQLKMEVFKDYLEAKDNDVISAVGIRREESKSRSKVTEWEYNSDFDCQIWRPIYKWTEKNVIDIHKEFNVIPNSLYLKGDHRVGCYPCIYARKKQISNLPSQRVEFICKFETLLGNYVKKHTKSEKLLKFLESMKEKHGYYFKPFFFQYSGKDPFNIVSNWSKTTRGGKQMMLFDQDPPACVKWGLCDL
jgi:3'-phosphoadenosine 5'-phosphosulfate sulfotransferase (PAPS reductase)/FAD synthetase